MRTHTTRQRFAAVAIGLMVVVGLVAVALLATSTDPRATGAPSDATPVSPSGGGPDTSASPASSGPTDAPSGSVVPTTDYMLMPGSELLALPTTGPAWEYLLATARSRWPRPDFSDLDNQTDTLAFAAGLVYARTGDTEMRAKARDAIMAVIPTFTESRLREGLGPLRQTAGWVLAADLVQLEGEDDAAFRAFLERVLTDRTGRHSRWGSVVDAHDDSENNWGAWAGAARIAATVYLDRDLDDAVNTFRGFLGDRRSWSEFFGQSEPLPTNVRPWACDPSPSRFTPVNRACTRAGIDLDGAIPADISRGSEGLQWPPAVNGIMYTHETLAGYSLQAELLYRNGYLDIWSTEDDALRRMADVIGRSEEDGGPGWNPGRVQYHIAWLLNLRYGTDYPTVPAEYGRAFGFTDWLYGS